MLPDLVIARLKDQVPDIKRVGSAVDLAGARAGINAAAPCVYVISLAEQAGALRYLSGMPAQKRTLRIGVVLMVRNVRDATGSAASADMDALRQQTDAALFGWLPDEAHSPLVFGSGKLLGLMDAELWWQDEYTTEFDRR